MTDLHRMRQLMKRLPNILWEIEKKEANATRITASITGMPRGGGGKNREEDARIMLIAAKDSYREALEELESLRKELEPELAALEDENERAMMRMRYIHGYEPEKIAQTINYHPRTVYRRLKSAERKLMRKSCQ
jgi:RNA polymerase sigma factor (sigma-70 family)